MLGRRVRTAAAPSSATAFPVPIFWYLTVKKTRSAFGRAMRRSARRSAAQRPWEHDEKSLQTYVVGQRRGSRARWGCFCGGGRRPGGLRARRALRLLRLQRGLRKGRGARGRGSTGRRRDGPVHRLRMRGPRPPLGLFDGLRRPRLGVDRVERDVGRRRRFRGGGRRPRIRGGPARGGGGQRRPAASCGRERFWVKTIENRHGDAW